MKAFRSIVPILLCLLLLAGCEGAPGETAPPVEDSPAPEVAAWAAYSALLAGDRTRLDEEQTKLWWIPDFSEDGMEYEYTCLDLDGDGISELVVQLVDDPCGYNGVFHFVDGNLVCWNSDGVEMSCRDYPLDDGTMVRQYDTSGSRIYLIFRYQADGEMKEILDLFAREEPLPYDGSTEPWPYYEVDGIEVDQARFEEQLAAAVTDRMLARSAWTRVGAEEQPQSAAPDSGGTEEVWTEEEIAAVFADQKSDSWEIIDCVSIPDLAYDRVGAVLFRDKEEEVSYVAFVDAAGNDQRVGVYAEPYSTPDLAYLGDGVVTFELQNENGTPYCCKVTLTIDGSEANFKVEDDGPGSLPSSAEN